ncbi:MAG: DNA topoisomerase IV subunit A [Sphaerochaetaceae bacterium]
MAHAEKIFKENFLEYASYVIKERAIAEIADGLKPVQRRILHSLFEMDDGKFHKVANIVGHCMKYHPHGDASIGEALVNLANMELFIDKQGNFGNEITGDSAAAPRYIEARALSFAKKVLYNPPLTTYVESYDGRNKEPLVFPAKLPVVLVQGTEGIAVGMSTKILPHNLFEVIDAIMAALEGKKFELYPDFYTKGIIDVSSYDDGTGRVLVRAKLNTKDPKRIVIEELPYGVTTERMIKSIEDATRKGKLKISSINDYTTDEVNIEITLARNTYSDEVVDALYGFTACEQSITVNPLLIKDGIPTIFTVSEIINHHAKQLVEVLKGELNHEKGLLLERLHERTLERIFVEERIYKVIEQKRSQQEIEKAVIEGFVPFASEIGKAVTGEDIVKLLKIPIRRISLFDIEKNREEILQINERIKEIESHLKNLIRYALDYLKSLKELAPTAHTLRKTKIGSFKRTDVREVASRDFSLKYDSEAGYLGYELRSGTNLFMVSPFDRVLIIQKEGTYFVTDVPKKLYVGKQMRFCTIAEKELLEKIVFTIIYQERNLKYLFIKRCNITQFILNRTYELLPKGDFKLYGFSTFEDARLTILFKKGKGYRSLEDKTYFSRFPVKGVRAKGVRLTTKEAQTIRIKKEFDNADATKDDLSLFKGIDPFDDEESSDE